MVATGVYDHILRHSDTSEAMPVHILRFPYGKRPQRAQVAPGSAAEADTGRTSFAGWKMRWHHKRGWQVLTAPGAECAQDIQEPPAFRGRETRR